MPGQPVMQRNQPHYQQDVIVSSPSVPGLCPYFQPFYQPNECGKALCVRPDMMELDELYEFPEFSRDPTMYLALRNLILASWNRNCMVLLTSANVLSVCL